MLLTNPNIIQIQDFYSSNIISINTTLTLSQIPPSDPPTGIHQKVLPSKSPPQKTAYYKKSSHKKAFTKSPYAKCPLQKVPHYKKGLSVIPPFRTFSVF